MSETSNRPLSPHLQIYRPQITSVLSILHRITGVLLAGGLLVLVAWLSAAATGRNAFEAVQSALFSIVGLLAMLGITGAFFYHAFNGVRHLVWDAGWGFDLRNVNWGGWAVLILATALTAGVWIRGLTS